MPSSSAPLARLMRISGPRGSGKTVLLTELGDRQPTGECLDVLSGVVEDALRYVQAARGRIASAE